MANVIVGQKKIGRPIRLEEGCLIPSFRQFIFVRINHFGIAMRLQKLRKLKKRVRFDYVVVIEKANPFAPSERESLIRSGRNACVFPDFSDGDAAVACSQSRQSVE